MIWWRMTRINFALFAQTKYRQISNISRTLEGNKIVDHSTQM